LRNDDEDDDNVDEDEAGWIFKPRSDFNIGTAILVRVLWVING
jgi:hypothetical protein